MIMYCFKVHVYAANNILFSRNMKINFHSKGQPTAASCRPAPPSASLTSWPETQMFVFKRIYKFIQFNM